MLKKSVSIALLSSLALMSVQSLQPRPAQAAVGALAGNVATMVAGGSLMGLVGFAAIVSATSECTHPSCMSPAYGALYGAGAMALGLLVLDGDTAEFGTLSLKQARLAGLSPTEKRAFNEELPEINAIHAQVMKELAAEYQATREIDVNLSRALWNEYGSELSPEAFTAVKKISNRAIQQASRHQRKR